MSESKYIGQRPDEHSSSRLKNLDIGTKIGYYKILFREELALKIQLQNNLA